MCPATLVRPDQKKHCYFVFESSIAMRIDTLELHNFRCFERIKVDFHPELTVLVAPNAGGKTSVLDAVAVALSPYVARIGETPDRALHESDSRQSYVRADGTRASLPTPFNEILLHAEGTVDGQAIEWRRGKHTLRGKTTIAEAKALTQYAAGLHAALFEENARSITLPLVAYYGTSRLLGNRPLAARENGRPIQARTAGYQGCLNSGSRFDTFSKWYASASFSELVAMRHSGFDSPERTLLYGGIHCVEDAVHHALRNTYGACWLNYDELKGEITLHDNDRDRSVSLRQQSDGVKAIISLIGDLASRAWLLNPQHGRHAAQETPGIVLIDEVDMHLHPTWQQGVVQSLRDAFPKVQFILTTHSPQVLSTVDRECIRILQQNGDQWYAEAPDEQTSGGESSYIMATVMGASEIPESDITRKMDDYTVLIEQGEWASEHAVNLREELDKHYDPKHPRILDCDRLIRFQSFKVKRGEAG